MNKCLIDITATKFERFVCIMAGDFKLIPFVLSFKFSVVKSYLN